MSFKNPSYTFNNIEYFTIDEVVEVVPYNKQYIRKKYGVTALNGAVLEFWGCPKHKRPHRNELLFTIKHIKRMLDDARVFGDFHHRKSICKIELC